MREGLDELEEPLPRLRSEHLAVRDAGACEAFGVWVEKSMYGKKYMGIDRATFLFDAQGSLVERWRLLLAVAAVAAGQAVLRTRLGFATAAVSSSDAASRAAAWPG